MSKTLVQYILMRSDLNWPLGAIVAQGCHAATAALHRYKTSNDTQSYLNDLENMHKVVLSITDEGALSLFSEKLEAANIDFVAWREQPENILTAIALRPYIKSEVQAHFKGLPLLR